MGKATFVPVRAPVVDWAVRRSGIAETELARRLKVELSAVRGWRDGTALPTKTQFGQLAGILHVPTAVFFAPVPPSREDSMVHFRAPAGQETRDPSPAELRAIASARGLQQTLSWALSLNGQADFVGLPWADGRTPPDVAATSMRDTLGIAAGTQRNWPRPTVAFQRWREALETLGVSVLQVELGRTGIRGFSLHDKIYPLLAVNGSFGATARIFSAFHELGHLLRNDDSACIGFAGPRTSNQDLERWCESFAASLLLPRPAIEAAVGARTTRSPAGDLEIVSRVATSFKVSNRAVALRLIELGFAEWTLYRDVEAEWPTSDFPQQTRSGGGGMRAPQLRLKEFGAKPTRIILRAAETRQMTELDAMRKLHLGLHDYEELSHLLEQSA